MDNNNNNRFQNKGEAKACIERQPFFCGVMFDVGSEHCVGMNSYTVVTCTAINRGGRKVCTTPAEVDEFVAQHRVR